MNEVEMAQATTTKQAACGTLADGAAELGIPVAAFRERVREWESQDALPFPILRIGPRTTRIPWEPFMRYVRGESVAQ